MYATFNLQKYFGQEVKSPPQIHDLQQYNQEAVIEHLTFVKH